MSPENEEHPVPATLDAFEKVFQAIKDLAMIGQISQTEDEILAGITDQLTELHTQFSEREMLNAMKANGYTALEDESTNALKRRLQTRLVMQAETNRGSDLSELATQELFDTLDEDDAN